MARYISYYTNPGDIVLDSFAGSGVTVIEAVRAGRKGIAIDLNPVACFLMQATLRPTNVDGLTSCIGRLRSAVQNKIDSYYGARCSQCGKDAIATHFVWKTTRYKGDQMYRVRVRCDNCNLSEERSPTDDDIERYENLLPEAIPFFFPENVPLHSTAKRSVEFIHDLFTHRALICLSILLHEINSLPEFRTELRLAFISSLAQVSRMPPYAQSSGISWKVPNYWVPPLHWERHVWQAFDERLKKLVRGKQQAATVLKDVAGNYRVEQGDATCLPITDDSVDYIFTDPPYGDSLPYLGLSLMWAAWLQCDKRLPFEHEILIAERGNYEAELQTYRDRLAQAFREMYRVLKNNGTVTVTFHNREIRVWNALVSAACEAGFVYANDNYVLPAVKSSKAQLAVSGSMTGDVYINFLKPPRTHRQKELNFDEIHEILVREATMIIESRNGQATTDQLARGIYSHLIKANLFAALPSSDIRELLSTVQLKEIMPSVWSLPNREKESFLEYIPLTRRVAFIIDSVLASQKKSGYMLDDFLIPIFTQLKNGLTPETKEIIDVLEQCAEVKGSKWFPLPQMELLPAYKRPGPLAEDELHEHEQFIYQLARLGGSLGYQIWVGQNEQNKSGILRSLSVRRLEIPGLTEQFINKNRLHQIDLIWLNPDEGLYVAFEIENSTGVVPGIQRLANLTQHLSHLKIPTYVVIPDKFRWRAQRLFDSPSGRALSNDHRKVVVYSRLLHQIDLLSRKLIDPADVLDSIAEAA